MEDEPVEDESGFEPVEVKRGRVDKNPVPWQIVKR